VRYLSVCSGIEAATVAWEPLGWEPVAFSELEKFPSAVLAHHYPDVPNLGDMTQIQGEKYRGRVDILAGGTPCQAFSVAGLRAGLIDPRGNLTLAFARLADDIQPPYIVWENVPGVLSSKDNAFGCFLGLLAGEDGALVPPGGKWTDAGFVLGPQRTVAWRVLDAQYFGLAQRRRRVFVVACPRGGADPREILFEREGLRRDTPPSREAGQGAAHDVAPCIGASVRGFERGGDTRGQDPVVACLNGLSEYGASKPTLRSKGGDCAGGSEALCVTGQITHALTTEGADASEDGTGRGTPVVCFGGNNTKGPLEVSTACNAHGGPVGRLDFETETFVVSVALRGREGGATAELGDDCGHALRASGGGDKPHVLAFDTTQMTSALNRSAPKPGDPCHPLAAMQVRRLVCEECEALQGFPRGYTLIPWRGKPAEDCPDGPRYKALGNSFAVPVVRWIGRRIALNTFL